MAGLPKKYAKMGFKKGWAAFKRSRKSSRAKHTSQPAKTRGKHMSKFSVARAAKGAIYAASLAAPGYNAYLQAKATGMDNKAAAVATAKAYAGMNLQGNFDMAVVAQIYTPVAVVAIGDFVTSKVGIQRRVFTALNGLMG